MIYVRGADSVIAKALEKLHRISPIPRGQFMPDDGERYLFCVGLIRQKRLRDQTEAEASESFLVNAVRVIRECDRLLETNPRARICVVGSESAYKWSFDGAYAASKAALHRYVETKRLRYPDQQLVCVAPTCIEGSAMNLRRNEDGKRALAARVERHPKKRWLQPIEVARMVHHLLCVDEGYTTGITIRMNGGEHCWDRW